MALFLLFITLSIAIALFNILTVIPLHLLGFLHLPDRFSLLMVFLLVSWCIGK